MSPTRLVLAVGVLLALVRVVSTLVCTLRGVENWVVPILKTWAQASAPVSLITRVKETFNRPRIYRTTYSFTTPPRHWTHFMLFLPAKPVWWSLGSATGAVSPIFSKSYALEERNGVVFRLTGTFLMVSVALRAVYSIIPARLFILVVTLVPRGFSIALGVASPGNTVLGKFRLRNTLGLHLPARVPISLAEAVPAHLCVPMLYSPYSRHLGTTKKLLVRVSCLAPPLVHSRQTSPKGRNRTLAWVQRPLNGRTSRILPSMVRA